MKVPYLHIETFIDDAMGTSSSFAWLDTDDPAILGPVLEAEENRCRISVQCAQVVVNGFVGTLPAYDGRTQIRIVFDTPWGPTGPH